MRDMFRISRSAIAICLFASAAFAESGGTITGTIDGQPETWRLSASQSDWNDYGVSLMGRRPESPVEVGTIMIGFQKDAGRFQVPEVRLLGSDASHAGGEDEGVSVRVERWETDGETLSLAGAVVGPVYLITNMVGPELDTTSGHQLDLTFDLTITNP